MPLDLLDFDTINNVRIFDTYDDAKDAMCNAVSGDRIVKISKSIKLFEEK